MPLFSSRLPHVLTRSDLIDLVTPTYARETGISDELAHERVTRALKSKEFVDRLYSAFSTALASVQGARTEDAIVDALSKAVPKRCGKMQAAPASPGLSAVIVTLNIQLDLAPLALRGTLDTDKGRALLNQGFSSLAKYWVSELVR